MEGGGAGGGAAPAMMPMGMPLGGGGAAAGAKNEPEKSKKVVAQESPHTEAVTGKITGDRVAISAIASAELRGDPRVEGAVVKRIASAARGEDPS